MNMFNGLQLITDANLKISHISYLDLPVLISYYPVIAFLSHAYLFQQFKQITFDAYCLTLLNKIGSYPDVEISPHPSLCGHIPSQQEAASLARHDKLFAKTWQFGQNQISLTQFHFDWARYNSIWGRETLRTQPITAELEKVLALLVKKFQMSFDNSLEPKNSKISCQYIIIISCCHAVVKC